MNESIELFSLFKTIFVSSSSNIRHFSSPGRINIIGEHVDYLGGIVLPAAIDFSLHALIQENATDEFHFYSSNFKQLTKHKRPFVNSEEFSWANYILGVILELEKKGFKIPGFNLLIQGNIPQGAGLSSSAALEVVVGYAISNLFGFKITKEDIALIGQAAENHFVGTNCGIMDQFIIATGKKDHCISLNTRTLKYEYHQFDLLDHEFYLINSNVKHSLKDSDYNRRRSECESALAKIQKIHPKILDLYSFDKPLTEQYNFTEDEKKRVLHVISEKIRTMEIIKFLESGNINIVGRLLYECHWSLSKQFEVSCPETDFIVSTLQSLGATGARMIGGGFGGCVLVLDHPANFSRTAREIQKNYEQKFGYDVSFHRFKISDGVKEIN
jgi:galactokinase